MIETLLALVPTYGVWLILISVALSCLAFPIPSSMLVMAAGGFAAAGDFSYWQLVLFAFCGFLLGDQLAFALARKGGAPLIARLREGNKTQKVVESAETMIERRGSFAVVLTRTIFSPVGPYVAFVAGALLFGWLRFTTAATFGAAIWSLGYSWLGYMFASHIAEIASLIGTSVGIVLAGAVVIGLLWWLVRSYRSEHTQKHD